MKRLVFLSLAITGCMGGRVEQAPACASYVSCIQALDARQQTVTNLDRFNADGACWANGDTGELCQSGCERGLAWLRARQPDLPKECAP